jgi:tRNA(Ile)-lysidine synthetase-like protein
LTGVRNRIRNSWLPDLESHAPDERERLVKRAAAAQAVERGISNAADIVRREAELRPGVYRTELLRRVDTPVLHEVLSLYRPAASEVARLAARLDEEPVRASILELRTGPAIAIGRDYVTVSTAPPSFPGRLRLEPFPLDRFPGFLEEKGPLEEVVDADRVDVSGLSSRARRPGDRLRPLGAPGTRKVKSILADDGVPGRERVRWPIIVDAAEAIVWVVGVRLSHDVRVRPGETTRAVRLVWEF